MKNKDLLNAIGNAKDEYILEAKPKMKKAKNKRHRFAAAIAAVLVIAIIGGIWGYTGESPDPNSELFPSLKAYAVAEPAYPEMAKYPNWSDFPDDDGTAYSQAFDEWSADKQKQRNQFPGYSEGLDSFFSKSIEKLMTDTKGENKVYSPLSLYMALCMLAEVTDGNSRQQILDLLTYDSIEDCRTRANAVWNANYCDDGMAKITLANSLWLNENIEFNKETIDTLAQNYYSSTYQGEMGSDGINKAMQDWVNQQTGELLDDYVSQMETTPDTVLNLISTVYFNAKWSDPFISENTEKGTFRSPGGDITCDFMKQTLLSDYYYRGDKYSAASKNLNGAGNMWFILPDEGVTTDELLQDSESMKFLLSDGNSDNKKQVKINISVPKFDISSNTDLAEDIKELGVTDVFDDTKSDFSPTTDAENLFISKVEHAARVMIDEEGCTAAAYTSMFLDGTGAPPDDEVDFILDRPFIFVITGAEGLPLFVGVVNNP